MESDLLQNLILLLIVVNAVLLGITTDNPELEEKWVEYVFTSIFTLEVLLKVIGLGTLFWVDGW